MSHIIESPKIINLGNKRNRESGTTQQLIFHIPSGMRANINVALEEIEQKKEPITFQANVEPQASIDAVDVPKEIEAVESTTLPVETKSVNVEPSTSENNHEVSIEIQEITEDYVIPYFMLKLKNSAAVYKVGTSYIKDIENGKKHFGFASIAKGMSDLHLLVYGSFINYSLKKPVLIVVKDIEDKAFDKYRDQFTKGTLWKWDTYDWGRLCFVDYKQINKCFEDLKHLDIDFITNEFVSVLWSLPNIDVQDELNKSSLMILNKINSITMVVSASETKNNDLKKSTAYYNCFDIPTKGILIGESPK